MSIAVAQDWTIDRTARHLFDLHIVEILLAQVPVLDKLQPQLLDELANASITKLFEKEKAPGIYGYAGREGSLWIAGRVLMQKGSTQLAEAMQQDPALASYLETGRADGSVQAFNAVLSAAGYSRLLGQDEPSVDDYSTYVYTPNGSPVSVIYTTWELSQADINAMDYYFDTTYPLADRLRSASRRYNCHSYAWYSQDAGNTIWMDDPQTYWDDGSYEPTTLQSPGVRLVYAPERQHSALVDSPNGYYVKSKWGQAGLYGHPYWYGPYGSSVDRYKRSD